MHVLSGDLFVGKPFLAQLCGVGCQQEKAQEPLVGGGRCWEATKIVNTHPRLGGGKGSHSIPTTPGHLGPPGRLAGRGGGGGGGSLSPGVLPMGKSLMGLLQGPTAGRGKKGLGAPWAVEEQRSPSGREAALGDRIAPSPRPQSEGL